MAAQRALIVENEPLIAFDLEAILRALGFDVCGLASNPREAVELATSRRPDLVLMDVYLDEGLQGIKAAKWLRDACDIPVLFVTGHSDPDTVARIREALPEVHVCAKPVAPHRLAEAIAGATGWQVPSGPAPSWPEMKEARSSWGRASP
jgi:DNA-binding NarL/FixJ family response regulator